MLGLGFEIKFIQGIENPGNLQGTSNFSAKTQTLYLCG
jgi:hypothetical protein